MPRPRQAACGKGLHSFEDPANYYVVYDKSRDQYRRKCRPCALARKRAYNARQAQERAVKSPPRPWWEQLEWVGPHRAKDPWQRLRRRKRYAQNYKVRGHPIAYRPNPQQITYVQALADGLSVEEIAEREHVTPNTVHNGMVELRRKWGVSSNAAAVAQGLKRGVLRADRATAKRLPRRISPRHVEDVRALVRGERLPHKGHKQALWRLLDPLMSWSEAHAVSVLWAAGRITSRDVPQTRNRYRRRRTGKPKEDAAAWTATTMGAHG
ncbi:LuxR C-terminal-related transcriptional regulator [Streptomyces sp. NPDC026659]|uniref:LuxR C-terminal-related transcriptional regulator n=1 Tax=Streptomyces sp. NPDC026659 TaxID=3155123 RepID=UPI0033DD4E81